MRNTYYIVNLPASYSTMGEGLLYDTGFNPSCILHNRNYSAILATLQIIIICRVARMAE
jgi:hypothetical protein